MRSTSWPFSWIDAVFINQTDHEEKVRPVPRIDLVYSNANTVIVWLGLPGRCTNEAMDTIDSLIDCLASIDGQICQVSSKNLKARGLPGLGDPIWEGIGDLVHRRYFRRLWTVQEFTLAERCLIFYDEKSINSSQLTTLTENLRSTGMDSILDSQSIGEKHIEEPHVRTMNGMWYAQTTLLIQRYRHFGDTIPLAALLSLVRIMESSEPVDRVYAILALTEATVLHDIGVDYSDESRRNYWRLYTHVGHIILREMDNLDLFSHISASEELSQLPSWFPNWNTRPEVWELSPKYYEAGPKSPNIAGSPHIASSLDKTQLMVHATKVDKVSEIGELSFQWGPGFWDDKGSQGPEGYAAIVINWLDECWKIAHRQHNATQEPLLRVLCANWLLHPESYNPDVITPQNAMRTARAFIESIKTGIAGGLTVEEETQAQRYLNTMMRFCIGRRLFSTRHGRLGLGPRHIQPGDVIYVLDGQPTPFILRPEPEQDCFKLVGQTYVHGIMHGELFKEEQPAGSVLEQIITIA